MKLVFILIIILFSFNAQANLMQEVRDYIELYEIRHPRTELFPEIIDTQDDTGEERLKKYSFYNEDFANYDEDTVETYIDFEVAGRANRIVEKLDPLGPFNDRYHEMLGKLFDIYINEPAHWRAVQSLFDAISVKFHNDEIKEKRLELQNSWSQHFLDTAEYTWMVALAWSFRSSPSFMATEKPVLKQIATGLKYTMPEAILKRFIRLPKDPDAILQSGFFKQLGYHLMQRPMIRGLVNTTKDMTVFAGVTAGTASIVGSASYFLYQHGLWPHTQKEDPKTLLDEVYYQLSILELGCHSLKVDDMVTRFITQTGAGEVDREKVKSIKSHLNDMVDARRYLADFAFMYNASKGLDSRINFNSETGEFWFKDPIKNERKTLECAPLKGQDINAHGKALLNLVSTHQMINYTLDRFVEAYEEGMFDQFKNQIEKLEPLINPDMQNVIVVAEEYQEEKQRDYDYFYQSLQTMLQSEISEDQAKVATREVVRALLIEQIFGSLGNEETNKEKVKENEAEKEFSEDDLSDEEKERLEAYEKLLSRKQAFANKYDVLFANIPKETTAKFNKLALAIVEEWPGEQFSKFVSKLLGEFKELNYESRVSRAYLFFALSKAIDKTEEEGILSTQAHIDPLIWTDLLRAEVAPITVEEEVKTSDEPVESPASTPEENSGDGEESRSPASIEAHKTVEANFNEGLKVFKSYCDRNAKDSECLEVIDTPKGMESHWNKNAMRRMYTYRKNIADLVFASVELESTSLRDIELESYENQLIFLDELSRFDDERTKEFVLWIRNDLQSYWMSEYYHIWSSWYALNQQYFYQSLFVGWIAGEMAFRNITSAANFSKWLNAGPFGKAWFLTSTTFRLSAPYLGVEGFAWATEQAAIATSTEGVRPLPVNMPLSPAHIIKFDRDVTEQTNEDAQIEYREMQKESRLTGAYAGLTTMLLLDDAIATGAKVFPKWMPKWLTNYMKKGNLEKTPDAKWKLKLNPKHLVRITPVGFVVGLAVDYSVGAGIKYHSKGKLLERIEEHLQPESQKTEAQIAEMSRKLMKDLVEVGIYYTADYERQFQLRRDALKSLQIVLENDVLLPEYFAHTFKQEGKLLRASGLSILRVVACQSTIAQLTNMEMEARLINAFKKMQKKAVESQQTYLSGIWSYMALLQEISEKNSHLSGTIGHGILEDKIHALELEYKVIATQVVTDENDDFQLEGVDIKSMSKEYFNRWLLPHHVFYADGLRKQFEGSRFEPASLPHSDFDQSIWENIDYCDY